MERFKRALSLILCFVMVFGLMPMNVFAEGTVIDAAIFCSDVHGSTSDLTSVLGGVAKSGVDYSSIGFVGDTCLTVANTTSIVQSALNDTDISVMFSYAASHDTEDGADIDEAWDYSGEVENVSENYLVYTIRETDMENDNGAEADFTTWYSGLTAAQKKLPIFIMSHRPLHARRNDNAGAAAWYNAISAAAETSDIVFFWAHNHTSESSVDTAAYYVAKDGTETFTVYNGSTVVPNFTYMNAGYINANNQNPGRINVATTVQITEDSLIFQDYTTSGEYTNSSYSHNVTVARQFTSSTDSGSTESTDPSEETTAPTEGSGESSGTTTTTTYNYTATASTDGTGYILVSNGYALQNNNGSISAVAVTVSDDGSTVTFDSSVDVSTILWTIDAEGDVQNNGYFLLRSSGSGTKSMTISTTDSGDAYSNWTYSSDTLTTTGGSGNNTTFYAYCTDGTFSTQSSSSQELKFYVPTETEVAVTLSSIAVTTEPTTVYNVGDTFSTEGMVVTATYSDGSTAEVTDYTLSDVDMTIAGTKTVTVTYTEGDVTKETTFDITVNESISDTATVTGIAVSGGKTDFTLGESFSYEGLVVTATYDDNGTTKTKVLSADEYTVSEPDMTTEGEKTVTVTANGTDVTATYTINVVEADSNSVTLGSTNTTKKTVYVLTSSITSGTSYLVVNGNSAGSYYALANNSGSVAATGVTVKTDSTIGTYIELTDATDELWTVSGSSSTTLKNGNYYVVGSVSRGSGSLSLSTSSSSATTWTWSSSNNRLYASFQDGRDSRNFYVRYSSGWGLSSSSNNVYFYVPTEISSTVDTAVKYTMRAEDLKQVVSADNADTLTAKIDFCLQGNGSDLTTLPSGGSYAFTELSDPNGIIESIDSEGNVTFSGTTGTAKVTVAYTWTVGEDTYTIYKNITIEAAEPYYELDLHKAEAVLNEVTGLTAFDKDKTYYTKNEDGTYTQVAADATPDSTVTYYYVTYELGEEITAPIAIKGVEAGDPYGVWAVVTGFDGILDSEGNDGADMGSVGSAIEWSSSDESIATVDPVTGVITFTGKEGTVEITAAYAYGTEGKVATDTITISVTPNKYTLPADGTSDFPEYPNEGAIRYDKTATAVGNFSETGIAQIELSMTGVPYSTGSEIDVVLMLDMTGSMSSTAMTAAEESAIAFAQQIVKNTDGTYNENRVAVLAFNSGSSSPYTLWSMGVITADTWDSFCTAVRTASDKQVSGGTPYDEALSECQSVLAAAKTDGIGNDRQQFCVFVSDGGPTSYEYITNYDEVKAGTDSAYDTSTASATGGTNQSDSNFATIATYTHEYYSTLMKDDGITMYSVLTGLSAADYPNCTTILENIASDSSKAYVVEDGSDTSALSNAFTTIATEIMQAATDVTVEDQITDEYTMIFDIPTGSVGITGVTNDFYIEFGKYALDENHERTEDGYTSVTKLYLQNTNGVLSAKDSEAPVFEQKTIGDKGTLYYWSTNADDGDTGVSVTVEDGTTYYFVSYGLEKAGYNMTSGAYADGTVDSTTNMSTDLVIATPYFVYNASTKMLYWTVDKLDTYEYALRYFLYLDDSATEVGTDKEVDAATYPTNNHAYITYTNFNGNDCRQTFPIPQLTWNGAQVSYVFYLVNSAGQPINKSGQVVDFANATFVTDVYTTSVVWNKGEDGQIIGDSHLSKEWLAEELLPEGYVVYDELAEYKLMVYADASGEAIFNYFTIVGDTAANISSSLNERLSLSTTSSTVSVETTKVYNTKAGVKYDDYGTYTSKATDSLSDETILTNFDFANTTVAFAVVWEHKLVPDVIVVDYGLDVLINVVQNDLVQNTVAGIGTGNEVFDDANIPMNNGLYNAGQDSGKLSVSKLTTDGGATISIENENQIRYHQNDMNFAEADVFYYESPVAYYEGSEMETGYLYSSVTVIPATTIYYEDSFVDLSIWDSNDNLQPDQWAVVGTVINGVQDQDRPGESQLSGSIDADNIYGYDSAYAECSLYSMGTARKVTVDKTKYAEAQFTFYGTGFDIVSLTSNTTGTISVDVYTAEEFKNEGYAGDTAASTMVDTYYGYTQDADGNWVVDPDAKGSLYQVPVMKISDLEYNKYTVIITVAYNGYFDHQDAGSLDFYLDAIRIYDPAGDGVTKDDNGNVVDTTIQDAYIADGEGWPVYQELRNNVIDSANAGQIAGAVYIDGAAQDVYAVSDYDSYGPNNELYLAPGQAVAFSMNLDSLANLDMLHIGMKSANGGEVSYQIFDAAKIEHQGDVADLKVQTIATATDMYYDITALKDSTIVIFNSSENGAILSITNLKATFTADPGDVTINFSVVDENALNALLTALNTEEPVEEETTESTDPTEDTESTESTEPTEGEDTGDDSGSSSTIGQIINWLKKLFGWG